MTSSKRIPPDLQAQRKAQTELSTLAKKLATGRVETAFIFGSFSLGCGPMRAGQHSQGFRRALFSHENSVPRRTVRFR